MKRSVSALCAVASAVVVLGPLAGGTAAAAGSGRPKGGSTTTTTATTSTTPGPVGYDANDTGSLSAITRITGAQSMWDQGFTGRGIDVALIDTGVARVPGLDAAGKVIDGPDLSFDSQNSNLVSTDAFGHGTHMAGIIAGTDVAAGVKTAKCRTCLGSSAYTDTTKFVGVAPEARIVNVKIGAFDGSVDVSQVIAGIDWVVQHRNDNGMNIRVLNLSIGFDTLQAADVDPLVFAAEQAWKAGIVVVASAGNDGLATRSLASPALSSSIIAVGSSDPRGTLDVSDDVVPWFAQHGDGKRGVDVVAPGVSVISLRVPEGFVDQNVDTGKVDDRFQRGSGTSQSAAVVSGLAALALQKYPTATPDAVKAYLEAGARGISGFDLLTKTTDYTKLNAFVASSLAWYAGSGSAYVAPAMTMPKVAASTATGTGTGTLDAARGTHRLVDNGVELRGEIDIMGNAWNATTMAALTSARSTWTGGIWNGARWTGDSWTAVAWSGSNWAGSAWEGGRWKDASWEGGRWKDASWEGGRWKDASWEGGRWKDAGWSDASWS
jgi:serine protease AprX